MEVKTIFGTGVYQAETLLSEKANSEGKKVKSISLQLFQNGRIKLENGQLVSVEFTKEDAKELAIQLLKVSSEPTPQNGLSLDNYGEWGISLHHAIEQSGEPANEPIICLSDVEAEDIPEDGYLSICLTNEAAKEMISGLAMIV